jgi:hypothetical protein
MSPFSETGHWIARRPRDRAHRRQAVRTAEQGPPRRVPSQRRSAIATRSHISPVSRWLRVCPPVRSTVVDSRGSPAVFPRGLTRALASSPRGRGREHPGALARDRPHMGHPSTLTAGERSCARPRGADEPPAAGTLPWPCDRHSPAGAALGSGGPPRESPRVRVLTVQSRPAADG